MKWRAASATSLYGSDTAEVKATLEYNLGSGWQPWIEYTWYGTSATCPSPPDGGITCSNHVDSLDLPSSQETDKIQVRLTESIRLTHCDNCWLRISSANGTLSVYDIRVKADNCYIPTSEITTALGWNAAYPTAQDFRQTLLPPVPNMTFDRRRVAEEDPGGGGPDTCWFQGGPYASPAVRVTGGSWFVNSGNNWLPDTVGWLPGAVTDYRAYGRAPCQTSSPQRMVIDCGTGSTPYITNQLQMGIDVLTVWSERAGVYQERVWP